MDLEILASCDFFVQSSRVIEVLACFCGAAPSLLASGESLVANFLGGSPLVVAAIIPLLDIALLTLLDLFPLSFRDDDIFNFFFDAAPSLLASVRIVALFLWTSPFMLAVPMPLHSRDVDVLTSFFSAAPTVIASGAVAVASFFDAALSLLFSKQSCTAFLLWESAFGVAVTSPLMDLEILASCDFFVQSSRVIEVLACFCGAAPSLLASGESLVANFLGGSPLVVAAIIPLLDIALLTLLDLFPLSFRDDDIFNFFFDAAPSLLASVRIVALFLWTLPFVPAVSVPLLGMALLASDDVLAYFFGAAPTVLASGESFLIVAVRVPLFAMELLVSDGFFLRSSEDKAVFACFLRAASTESFNLLFLRELSLVGIATS